MKSVLQLLLVQCLVLFALLVLIDIGMHIVAPAGTDMRSVDTEIIQDLPGLKERITYSQGNYGLRSLSVIESAKPKGTLRILCLGASTTEQTTQSNEDTWCGVLERELNVLFPNAQVDLQTMAYGRGGLRAAQNAVWLQEMFALIQPDIVITLLGINDLAWNGGADYDYSGMAGRLQQYSDNDLGDRSKLWLKQNSEIFKRVYQIKRGREIKAELEAGAVVEWDSSTVSKLQEDYRELPFEASVLREPDPIVEFGDAVKWLVDFVHDQGSKIILLGQPVLWQADMSDEELRRLWFSVNTPSGPVRPSGAWLVSEMNRYNRVQENIATTAGATYIDLDKLIPKTTDYFFDDCHYTDLGSYTMAEHIIGPLSKLVAQSLP